jgi:hypothetical protein
MSIDTKGLMLLKNSSATSEWFLRFVIFQCAFVSLSNRQTGFLSQSAQMGPILCRAWPVLADFERWRRV